MLEHKATRFNKDKGCGNAGGKQIDIGQSHFSVVARLMKTWTDHSTFLFCCLVAGIAAAKKDGLANVKGGRLEVVFSSVQGGGDGGG